MFRLSSSSSIPQAGGGSPSKPVSPSPSIPGLVPPTDPLPTNGQSRPHDVLINRCHEVKRITKSLAAYFEGLATAHHAHSLALAALPKTIPTPLPQQSLFIPASNSAASASKSTNGVTPQGGAQGWHDLLVQTKETNKMVADEHAAVARLVSKEVVVPLKKLRGDIKTHVSAMEKDIGKLAEAVQKERDTSSDVLTRLAAALASSKLHSGPVSAATAPDPLRDPVILRAAAEGQLRSQVARENEMLTSVIRWTEKTEQKEKDVWREVARCWTIWEQANTSMLLSNQQRSIMLSADVEAIAPDTEWNHFVKLNHTIPADTPPKIADELDYPGRDDPLTTPVKEGLLERQKRFLKTWSSGFYVLTPTGHLHTYASSAVPIQTPASSLNLRLCTLGPMPTPDAVGGGTSKGNKPLEPLFTIEGNDGTKHVLRAKSWEELSGWWAEIEKYTKVAPVPDISTLGVRGEEEEDLDPEEALARERAQAEREMLEANELGAGQHSRSAAGEADIGQPTDPEAESEQSRRAVPPPPLPVRAPAAATVAIEEPQEADIGSSGAEAAPAAPAEEPASRSAPILTDSPDAPPRNSADLERVTSIEGGGDIGSLQNHDEDGKKDGE